MKQIKNKTKDKCNLCGWEGLSSEVVERESIALGTTWHCPICNSEDIEDINFNPYEDDDPEEDGGGEERGKTPFLGSGGFIYW